MRAYPNQVNCGPANAPADQKSLWRSHCLPGEAAANKPNTYGPAGLRKCCRQTEFEKRELGGPLDLDRPARSLRRQAEVTCSSDKIARLDEQLVEGTTN